MLKVKDVLANCPMDTEFAIYLPTIDNMIGRFGWNDKENSIMDTVDKDFTELDRRSLIPEEYRDRYCFIGAGTIASKNDNRLKPTIIPVIVLYLFPEDYVDEEKES